MFNPNLVAWAFAPEGSWEFTAHMNAGYTQYHFTICFVWHGVPGLP